jgi:hypothetical protein
MVGNEQDPEMRIFLIRFGTLTYAPVTIDDIEDRSDYAILLSKKHPLIGRMHLRLRSRVGTRPPAEAFVRMKVVFQSGERTEVFYVDAGGNLREWTSGGLFSLTKGDMNRIEGEIAYLEGVVDLKPEGNMRRLSKCQELTNEIAMGVRFNLGYQSLV